MAIVSKTARREEIPGEPGEWMEFRDLPALERLEARQIRKRAAVEDMRTSTYVAAMLEELLEDPNVGPRLKETMQKSADESKPFAAPAGPDPNDFDLFTCLHYGIVAWSYPEPCTDASKRDLDEETALWARNEIIRIRLSGAPLKND